MFEHCLRVYATMAEEAEAETVRLENGSEQDVQMWTGALTKLFGRLEFSTPYYTYVMDHLKRMGCVEQFRRGGGNTPSKWILHREPDAEAFENAIAEKPMGPKARLDIIEQRQRDQQTQINTLARAMKISF